MKLLLSLTILVAAIFVVHGSSVTWGRRKNNDFLLSRQVEVRSAIKNNFWNIDVDFPRADTENYYKISAIFVYDNFKNSTGAVPGLWAGGPGYRFAQVNLRSFENVGLNSTIEIYGR
ncbi:probable salivary secreted peptide [Drosophila miranda]|uniref:probable salivary secreted peptide n=1 Tax=Drosophila miranda TaxID=7229 RepID=UPI0007E62D27|nr:probable salivary secreted peptide [Drosophila miranda]